MLSNKPLISTVMKLLYIASLLVVLVELFTYPDSILNQTGISAKVFILALFGVHAVLFFASKQKYRFSKAFSFGNLFIVFPTGILLTTIALLLEEGRLFLNYFLEIYKINFEAVFLLCLPGMLFGFLHMPPSLLKKNWQIFFGAGSLLGIVFFGLYYLLYPFEYLDLVAEDGLVETATALLFFMSGLISFNLSRKKLFTNFYLQRVYQIGCVLVGAALSLIALEEISWGQRIFNIETPKHIANQNHQGEITIHNSEAFWPFVYVGYTVIGVYGAFLWLLEWILKDILPKNKVISIWKKILIPGAHLFFTFSFILLYLWLRKIHGPWRFKSWEELTELFLTFGILVHILSLQFSLKNKKHA